MQNKGALKFLAIMLAIACAFQLSFSFVTHSVRSDAAKIAAGNSAVEQAYLDSMKSQVVYNLGLVKYTYAECQEKEINLGLDLQGGMNITLEIAVEDVLTALSNNSTDPAFVQAMADAKKAMRNSTDDFITLFANAYRNVAPEGRLAAIFGTYELRNKITPESTNEQVIRVLRESCDAAIANSYNVLSTRIDRFGVVQPNIQRVGNTGRILVELPGIKDPERVRKLLQGTASLEFWTTYTAKELLPMMMQANQEVAKLMAAATDTTANTASEQTTAAPAANDTTDLLANLGTAQGENVPDGMETAQATSLFSIFQPMEDGGVIGMAQSYDTAQVNTYLNMPQVRSLFPRDVRFMWSIKGIKGNPTVFELYAIKGSSDGRPALDGSVITDAVGQYGQTGSAAEVSMSMNATGAKVWARLTADNVGRYIAVVLDGYVYSCPIVNGEITGGHSQITGDFTIAEAKDLANILQSGRLPAPAQIIQEAVVGPSLGQESINAGMTSFVLAFVLVLIYMLFFYHTAGFVANIALLANLFFLFGVLVSFGAVLTLPGIAGIVLTMGMAVDANVIIYERVKEEIHSGKGISLSIADGFKNAYSAIIDGNATTLITGIVLFIFGSGPVQGFATTLIIGIITSLFCSIFITRLIFVGMLEKGRNIKFWNRWTEHFLANTKIDFIKIRKFSYIASGIVILIMIVSLATKGLSYGVDFSGGRAYVVRFDKQVTANEVRAALEEVFTDGLEVKQYGNKDQKQMRIVTQYKYADDADGVTNEINEMMYKALAPLYEQKISIDDFTTTVSNPYGIISAEKVGPSIAHDIKVNSFIAVIFSLLAIGIYIAIRFKNWQYGMGGVVSLFHDAILTIGIFSLLYGLLPFNLTVDQSFIAAILTIIGYSINDTVVIFDRIRENMYLYPRRSRKDNINHAINSTLARTINTAGSTCVVLIAIFIFGGEVIRGFVFALLFGVVIGTYSSVFIATPVAYDMKRRKDKKENAKKTLAA
ncbi:MAG TPA: protein translocase subunit SecDF [Candidatus Rikenella faecigallinarum]|uniref:Multifunctional fusion protein n=1 Tax=Candidatus Rikenella faecigallinarum TaxID=2838745 RepID=A0A9D1TYG5_9BACT|nr:protein translocase subunit SecDF [Candidatus Rikenella faecigallinarum]